MTGAPVRNIEQRLPTAACFAVAASRRPCQEGTSPATGVERATSELRPASERGRGLAPLAAPLAAPLREWLDRAANRANCQRPLWITAFEGAQKVVGPWGLRPPSERRGPRGPALALSLDVPAAVLPPTRVPLALLIQSRRNGPVQAKRLSWRQTWGPRSLSPVERSRRVARAGGAIGPVPQAPRARPTQQPALAVCFAVSPRLARWQVREEGGEWIPSVEGAPRRGPSHREHGPSAAAQDRRSPRTRAPRESSVPIDPPGAPRVDV